MRKSVSQALESLERQMAAGFAKTESLEQRVVEGFARVDKQFLEVARRFDSVDVQIAGTNTNVDELRAEMYGQFDAVYQRLDRLETEYHMLVAGIRRIEEQMAEESKDRTQLRAQVEDLRERVKQLEERLKELQERLDDGPEPPPSKPS